MRARQVRGVRVGQSSLGRGVFATRAFYAGEILGRVRGAVLDDPDYGSDYCMEFGEGLSLEPEAPFRYLNHCCTPNCTLVNLQWRDDDGLPTGEYEIQVEALRTIRPGEQLTIDYAWPTDVAIPCRCGSVECRGWIVAVEELDTLRAEQAEVRQEWAATKAR